MWRGDLFIPSTNILQYRISKISCAGRALTPFIKYGVYNMSFMEHIVILARD